MKTLAEWLAYVERQHPQAVALGLDIYVMLDSSLSMDELLPLAAASGNQTKWDAVQEALRAFIAAPATVEIGVGLQYFPQVAPDVPFSCGDNDDCGPKIASWCACARGATARIATTSTYRIRRRTIPVSDANASDSVPPPFLCRPLLTEALPGQPVRCLACDDMAFAIASATRLANS